MLSNFLAHRSDKRRLNEIIDRYNAFGEERIADLETSDFKTRKYRLFFEIFAIHASRKHRESTDIENYTKKLYNRIATDVSGPSNIAYLRLFLVSALEDLPETPGWLAEIPHVFSFRSVFVSPQIKNIFSVATPEDAAQHQL